MARLFYVLVFSLATSLVFSQPAFTYSVANAHSHNDYEQAVPFYQALHAGFGSIEADIFLVDNVIYVAHTQQQINKNRSLDKLYLQPLSNAIKSNGGFPFKDSAKKLQMLIDLKNTPEKTIEAFIHLLKQYPEIANNKNITWTITGGQPDVALWYTYPSFIHFDGQLNKNYDEQALKRIAMFSGNLSDFTKWNGKSNIGEQDVIKLNAAIQKTHSMQKKIRFWNAPDFVNAWYQLMHLGVDYINTDKIPELQQFITNLSKNAFDNHEFHEVYQPKPDAVFAKTVKNVILFIGDGCGINQLYAEFTANKGRLNIFNMKNTGFSKTNSYDSYITDSAPGSNAFSSGFKARNRSVGMDHTGTAVKLLPEYLFRKKILTGVITTGDVTDDAG